MAETTSTSDARLRRRNSRFGHWPDLSFHFGLSFDDIRRMPAPFRHLYEDALPRLLAEEQSRTLDVVSYPHMDKLGQGRVTRRINRILEADRPPELPRTQEEMEGKAAAAGIAMEVVPA